MGDTLRSRHECAICPARSGCPPLFARILYGLLISTAAWGQAFDVVDIRVVHALPAGTVQVMMDEGPALVEFNPTGISHVLARPFAENGTMNLRYYTMRLLI